MGIQMIIMSFVVIAIIGVIGYVVSLQEKEIRKLEIEEHANFNGLAARIEQDFNTNRAEFNFIENQLGVLRKRVDEMDKSIEELKALVKKADELIKQLEA